MQNKISNFHEMIVLRNYAVYQESEETGILEKAIPCVDNYLIQVWHTEILITDEYLQNHQDIEHYNDIKRLNDKYKKLVEEEINKRIEE